MGTDWDEVKNFAEPIVAEIDQPDVRTLMRADVWIGGQDDGGGGAEFFYRDQSPERNAALLRYAARTLVQLADRQVGGPGGATG